MKGCHVSKALPFELPLDHQIQRSKLRRPQKVNQRALQALEESLLEHHQDLEQLESAGPTKVEDQDQLYRSVELNESTTPSEDIDRIESIDRVKAGLQPLLDESNPHYLKLINSLIDPC